MRSPLDALAHAREDARVDARVDARDDVASRTKCGRARLRQRVGEITDTCEDERTENTLSFDDALGESPSKGRSGRERAHTLAQLSDCRLMRVEFALYLVASGYGVHDSV
jgi:hypothetical protein